MILAHPDMNKSIANKRIAEGVKSKLENIEVRDIFKLYPDYKIDIAAEQKALMNADNVIFQYPFWWYNMPAILKAWFDEVFNFNFAYGPEGDKLKGKNFLLSFTIGGPADAYTPIGYNHFRVEDLVKPMEQTAYLAQMNFQRPIFEHGMVFIPGVYNTQEAVEERADRHTQRIIYCIEALENLNPEEQIKEFVHEWFAHFDVLADDGYFNNFIANGAKLNFPEGEYEGHDGFSAWYAQIKQRIKPDCKHTIKTLSIAQDKDFYKVNVNVQMQAEKYNGEAVLANVLEEWKVEITRDGRIKIHKYLVKEI